MFAGTITRGRTIGCGYSVPLRMIEFPFRTEGALVRPALEHPTAIELARRDAPRCPSCTHGARTVPIESIYAWRCRWGHVTYGEDMPWPISR